MQHFARPHYIIHANSHKSDNYFLIIFVNIAARYFGELVISNQVCNLAYLACSVRNYFFTNINSVCISMLIFI